MRASDHERQCMNCGSWEREENHLCHRCNTALGTKGVDVKDGKTGSERTAE